jgi:thioredoxin-related protein
MKKNVFLLLLGLFFASKINAQQSLFLDKDIATVFNESKLDGKPVVVMFYATWCSHCNKMKAETFLQKEVIDYYTSYFHCVAIDGESTTGIEFKQKHQSKFRVKSFPTFVFFDKDETVLGCATGEFNKEQFINEGKFILTPENQFNTVKKTFYEDVSNGDNCLKYVTLIKRAGFDPTLITQKYLNTKTESELISEYNWKVIANGINDIEAKEIAFVTAHKEEYCKVASPARVEKKLLFTAQDNLQPLVLRLDTLNYNKKRAIAASFKIRKVDSLVFRFDLTLAEKTKNWKKYTTIANESVAEFGYKDSNLLVEIATNFLSYIDDKNSLKNATIWMKQALQLGESLDKYKLTAQLYWKVNDTKNALELAQKGKNIALSNGWKTDEMDQLIEQIKKN